MPIPQAIIEANAPQLAAGVLQHPGALLLLEPTVRALADLVAREPQCPSQAECRLLSDALAFVDEIEIRLGLEARQ